jgi:hypothetical protein
VVDFERLIDIPAVRVDGHVDALCALLGGESEMILHRR